METSSIVILDFGSQYTQLIARRIREQNVFSVVLPCSASVAEIQSHHPIGLILSGGPCSVYDPDAPAADPEMLAVGLPILGICYGLQFLAHHLGGKVRSASKREYGPAQVSILSGQDNPLFTGLPATIDVWMSHGDEALELPPGFSLTARTANAAAGMADPARNIWAVQFHPEVRHTPRGTDLLRNFLFNICHAQPNWTPAHFIQSTVSAIREQVGDGRAICALSGGVDSSVASVLLNRAVAEKLQCVFIDTGLLREGEGAEVSKFLKEDLGVPVDFVDASESFISALRGVADPEAKRKIIGRVFAEVFEKYARQYGPFRYLAQGTLYPDVIESGHSSAPASVIKTHHNVGGLPKDLSMEVVEPLRALYKDEVRSLGALLGLPARVLQRHPFPGPGLAVRIIGDVTTEKLRVCRDSNKIVEDELVQEGVYNKVWQGFAYVGDDRVTGVLGDERKVGFQVTVKVVESIDAMTADWYRASHQLLEKISTRITNEVEGVVSVVYAISSKPPATIEPQ